MRPPLTGGATGRTDLSSADSGRRGNGHRHGTSHLLPVRTVDHDLATCGISIPGPGFWREEGTALGQQRALGRIPPGVIMAGTLHQGAVGLLRRAARSSFEVVQILEK